MKGWEKHSFTAAVILSAASGGVYFLLKSLWQTDDPFAAVNHPLQPYALDLHLLIAPVLVLFAGAIFRVHALPRIKSRDRAGRRVGYLLLFAFSVMTMSGYLLQVASAGWLRAIALYSHLLTGVSFPLLYGGHILTQRCRSSRKRALTREASEEGKVAA